jgi:hypothetical protein
MNASRRKRPLPDRSITKPVDPGCWGIQQELSMALQDTIYEHIFHEQIMKTLSKNHKRATFLERHAFVCKRQRGQYGGFPSVTLRRPARSHPRPGPASFFSEPRDGAPVGSGAGADYFLNLEVSEPRDCPSRDRPGAVRESRQVRQACGMRPFIPNTGALPILTTRPPTG